MYWIYKQKNIYYGIKSLLKTLHTGTKTLSTNANKNTTTKRKLFFGGWGKKKFGLGVQSFFVGGVGDWFDYLQGGLGDISMYRNTDIQTGSEWGILIIVKGGRSTEFQLCRHFLVSRTFSKRRAKK